MTQQRWKRRQEQHWQYAIEAELDRRVRNQGGKMSEQEAPTVDAKTITYEGTAEDLGRVMGTKVPNGYCSINTVKSVRRELNAAQNKIKKLERKLEATEQKLAEAGPNETQQQRLNEARLTINTLTDIIHEAMK